MPLYEYECAACGKRFEAIRKFSDPPLEVCAVCGKGPIARLQSSPAFQFKGSGWYITDYAQKGKSDKSGESGGSSGTSSESGTKGESGGKTDSSSKSDASTSSTASSSSSTPTAAKD